MAIDALTILAAIAVIVLIALKMDGLEPPRMKRTRTRKAIRQYQSRKTARHPRPLSRWGRG